MKTVKEILDSKGRYVWSVNADASVFEAIRLMAEKHIGALLVMEQGKFVGIITERDYARKVILEGRSSKETSVSQIMESNVLCVTPEHTLEQSMALMTEKRVRHLPVLNGSRVDGIISIGDLVKAIIAEQKFIIDQLVHYITG
jgi:CBS domain-containing protein